MLGLRRRARHEWLLWTGLLIAIVVFRWPMLKGFYYRTGHVSAPATSIDWRTDFTAALVESRRTGRPVLVDFTASWCAPCIAMNHDVWPDAAVERAVADSYIPLSIDVDRESAVRDRFGVDSIPTLLVLDGEGRVIRRAGYLPVSGMLRFLANR